MNRSKRFARNIIASVIAIAICTVIGMLPHSSAAREPLPATIARSRTVAAPVSSVYLPMIMGSRTTLGFVTTPGELAATKAQADRGAQPSADAVESLLSDADEALDAVPCAVATYTTKAGATCLNDASDHAYILALAYRVTDDARYSAKAAAFIRLWSTTLVGIDQGDSQAQLDWSRWVPAMIWGADLLEGSGDWTPTDRAQFSTMLLTFALPQGQAAATRTNNWADAGNLLRLSIAIYTNRPDERARAVADWKTMLNGQQQSDGSWRYGMLPDGSLEEENRRAADGLSYNQGALSLKTVFAEIMRRHGDSSLYSYKTPRGVGLKNGWDFLAVQVVNSNAGLCTWPYTDNHCVDYSNRSGWELAYAYWRAPTYMGPLLLHRPYHWSNWSDPGYSTLLFGNLNINGN